MGAPALDSAVMSGGPGIVVHDSAGISHTESEIVQIVEQDKLRSTDVRRERSIQNRLNWRFFHGGQDWSAKRDGQSRIFLPDLPMAVQQMAAALENQLITFEKWFSVETLGGLSMFDGDTLQKIVSHCLNRLWKPGNEVDTSLKFPTVLADVIILGLIESEICLKVFGVDSERPVYMLESTDPKRPAGMMTDDSSEEPNDTTPYTYERLSRRIKRAMLRTFRLAIDVVPFEDSYPDPGKGNSYHIHSVRRHISELRANPDYDPAVVEAIAKHQERHEDTLAKNRRAGLEWSGERVRDPNEVAVDEFWGDLICQKTGRVVGRNQLVTVAGNRILRSPGPNPMWHGYRPLVRCSLLRTPASPVHKAVLDHAVPMAEAENELLSLMTDGALKSVHGVNQVRPDLLLDPTSISAGIPAGFSGVMKKGAPANVSWFERLDTGQSMPQYADSVVNRLSRGRQVALMSNDLQLGNLPPRQVKATEIVEAQESRATLYENIAVRVEENLIEPTLQLGWMTMWQHLDDFSQPELIQILGTERAMLLQKLTPEDRFYLMVNNVKFKVRGLRAIMARTKEFQKLMALVNAVTTSPLLAMAFNQRFSTPRLLEKLVRSVNLDPTELEYRSDEKLAIDPRLIAVTLGAGGQAGGAAGGTEPLPGAAGSQAPGEIEQGFAQPNPTGMRGAQIL